MSFIAKNPLMIPEVNSAPLVPPGGTRGLFACSDGWYDIDSKNNRKKLSDEIYVDDKVEYATRLLGMEIEELSKSQPDWNETDATKHSYIKNKPTILTEEDVVELIEENSGGGGSINQIQSDWEQSDESKVDYIKNKPDVSNGYKKTVEFTDLCKIEDASPINHISYVIPEYDDGTTHCIIPRNFAPSTTLRIDGSVEILIPSIKDGVIYFGGSCNDLQEGRWEIVNTSGDVLISGDISLSLGYFRQEVVLPNETYKLIIYADVSYISSFYTSLDSDVNNENVPEAQPVISFKNVGESKWEAPITYRDVFYVAGIHPLDNPCNATFTYNVDINAVDLATTAYVDEKLGDIESIFDELHLYAQALILGGVNE